MTRVRYLLILLGVLVLAPALAVFIPRQVTSAGVLFAQYPVGVDSTPISLGAQLGFSSFTDSSRAAFASYLYPTMCVTAALREEARATRTAAAQMRNFDRRSDTLVLAPPTVHTAVTCGSRWTIANTDPFELPGLFRLAFMANQDDRAIAAEIHWQQLVAPRDTVAQAERLLRRLQWEMEIRPRTSARLRSLRRNLDAIQAFGRTAIEEQIDAQMAMIQLAGRVGELPRELAIADTIRRTIEALPSMAVRARFKQDMLEAAVNTPSVVFNLPADFTSPHFRELVMQGVAQAKRDLDTVNYHVRYFFPRTFDSLVYSQEGIRHPDCVGCDSLVLSLHVRPVRPLVAQYWFHRPDTTVVYPRSGVRTFIVTIDLPAPGYDTAFFQRIAAYRRLYAEFAPKGIDFIMMSATRGFFGRSTLLPLSAEVDSLRAYYFDSLNLPGILSVTTTTFDTLADGRRGIGHATVNSIGDGFITRAGEYWGAPGDIRNPEYEAEAAAFIRNHIL